MGPRFLLVLCVIASAVTAQCTTDFPTVTTTGTPSWDATTWYASTSTPPPTTGDASSTSPNPVYCTRMYSCLTSTTAQVCAPTPNGTALYEIAVITCPPENPTCNPESGTCYTPPCDSTQVALVTDLTDNICMRDGTFPDPRNYSRFFQCQEYQATTYACPPCFPYYNYVYGFCYSNDWHSIDNNPCQGFSGYKIGLYCPSHSVQYFLYCDNETSIAVDRCIGSNTFNNYYQECVPNCPYSGLYPSQNSCSDYYKCTSHSALYDGYNGYNITLLSCPEGQGFSETEFQCVDRSLVPNCNVNNTDLFNKR